MTATRSEEQELDRYNEQLWTLHQIHDSLLRIEHILALDFVARFGTEHEAEVAKSHLLNEFRAQAREVVDGHG